MEKNANLAKKIEVKGKPIVTKVVAKLAYHRRGAVNQRPVM